MRIHEMAHMIDAIMEKVPQMHRPALSAWFAARWDPKTGDLLHVEKAIEKAIWCDDCPDEHTNACDGCPIPRALDDTEVLNE